jgi:hypothetical protein
MDGLGECRRGMVHVSSWSGLLGTPSLGAAVHSCLEGVKDGEWPWVAIIVHGFRGSPFAWKGMHASDEELQRVHGVGVTRGGVRGFRGLGPGAESVGMFLLLPGDHVCLTVMSGEGDSFRSF